MSITGDVMRTAADVDSVCLSCASALHASYIMVSRHACEVGIIY